MPTEFIFPAITSLFAGIFALMLVPLTLQVGLKRIGTNVMFGDGGDEDLARRRAAQSNFTQYVPFVIVLLALVEMSGLPSAFVWAIGGLMLLGRLSHAYCFLAQDGKGNLRAVGMMPTMLSFLILGGALIYVFVTA